MNIHVTAAQPSVPATHLTDDELIRQIEHLYPRLGPALSTLVQRFKDNVDRINGTKPFESYTPEQASCPHCGVTLLLHVNSKQEQIDA